MGELIPTFSKLVSLLAAFAGVVGVGYFILGAYKYISSSGSAQKVEEAKEAMKQSLLGIVFILIAFTMVNTIISLIGDTTSGIQIGQLIGTDSSGLDGPEVVRVSSYRDTGSTRDRSDGVEIVFNEIVHVVNKEKIHIRSDRYGLGGVKEISPGGKTQSIRFAHPDALLALTCPSAGTPEFYIIEDLLLGSGASLKDEDGNPAIYVFSPTPVIHCKP